MDLSLRDVNIKTECDLHSILISFSWGENKAGTMIYALCFAKIRSVVPL
ncbi:uncharacterized protein MP3633_3219 [Marinomonas primoryensis]|uniref:Uncharacterized protein n=1 Tax=Marinomonas primoryensis TaxID=178399 RepID=A0A859CZ31_9GAMM|nr:uncharacterized protein MP3633_3219 [Marinomonas primoryensis]